MQSPATALLSHATSPLLRVARPGMYKAAGAASLVTLLAWAGPPMRSMQQTAAALLLFLWARWAEPARPPLSHRRTCCGRPEEGRRLAGPGLGDAVAERTSAMTVGRSPLRRAAPLSTAVGGSGE